MKNIKNYIFDLDNTLYDGSLSFFHIQMDRISKFIAKELGMGYIEACLLRDKYYHKYGTTMNGLVDNHNIDPIEFYAYVDDIPLDSLQPNHSLNDILLGITEKKYIFTNASDFHTQRVMKKLGLDSVGFDGIVTINTTNYIPKPNILAYDILFDKYNINPTESIFFEDSSSNLITADKFGMSTVLIEAEEDSYSKFIKYEEIHHFSKNVVDYFEDKFESGSKL